MKRLFFILVSCIFLASFGCAKYIKVKELANPYKDKLVYTTVNMRYDGQRSKGSYIAYNSLTLLPVNSRVFIKKITQSGFILQIPSGQIVSFAYKNTWGGKPIDKIIPLLFSETNISAEISKFNERDTRGIKIGDALIGMSKKGVIVAMGYPAVHMTPSTDQDVWTYWENRFAKYKLTFKDDKIIEVGALSYIP